MSLVELAQVKRAKIEAALQRYYNCHKTCQTQQANYQLQQATCDKRSLQ
jgi:hypothetical protein